MMVLVVMMMLLMIVLADATHDDADDVEDGFIAILIQCPSTRKRNDHRYYY